MARARSSGRASLESTARRVLLMATRSSVRVVMLPEVRLASLVADEPLHSTSCAQAHARGASARANWPSGAQRAGVPGGTAHLRNSSLPDGLVASFVCTGVSKARAYRKLLLSCAQAHTADVSRRALVRRPRRGCGRDVQSP